MILVEDSTFVCKISYRVDNQYDIIMYNKENGEIYGKGICEKFPSSEDSINMIMFSLLKNIDEYINNNKITKFSAYDLSKKGINVNIKQKYLDRTLPIPENLSDSKKTKLITMQRGK